jgi:maltose alpha-D-glucosyltransferase/alpha-amylase
MLQEFVPSRGDAWAFALERARIEAIESRHVNAAESFATAARRLGEVTRGLHEALAADSGDPDFAPQAATAEDVVTWGESTARQVKQAGEALAAQAAAAALPAEIRPLARTCLEHLPDTLARARAIAASFPDGAGEKIRHHGDYHLGQVLVTERGEFMILDFEGEPARPLAERRRRHSALRDVAGMVRSIAYAAAAATRAAGWSAPSDRVIHWESEARSAFLDGYFGAGLPEFLPQSTAGAYRLLELFEIEKVFYEIAYEVNHRPDWVEIPLRGVARALGAAP